MTKMKQNDNTTHESDIDANSTITNYEFEQRINFYINYKKRGKRFTIFSIINLCNSKYPTSSFNGPRTYANTQHFIRSWKSLDTVPNRDDADLYSKNKIC